MNMKSAPIVLAALTLTGCQVLYDTKVADTERDCEKLVSHTQVQACKQKTRDQMASYRREQRGKMTSNDRAENDDLCYIKKSSGEKACAN